MVKGELTFTFSCLAHYADQKEALHLLGHPNVLEICYGQLTVEDVDINLITLRFLR